MQNTPIDYSDPLVRFERIPSQISAALLKRDYAGAQARINEGYCLIEKLRESVMVMLK